MKGLYKGIKMGLKLIIILVLIYVTGIVGGSLFPKNKSFERYAENEGIQVYIYSNGFHSFLIFPIQSPERDWRNIFPLSDFGQVDSSFSYISLGWGDKAFFTETPSWEEFSLSTTLSALFLPTSTAIQVHYLPEAPKKGKLCQAVSISPKAYREILKFLDNSLVNKSKEGPQLIIGKGYTSQDNFYQAKGKYSIFYTCNTWVCEGLSASGVRTPLWTPFDKGLFYQLNRIP